MSSQDDLSITMMSGPRDGESYNFPLPDDDDLILTVGRREGCSIVLGYDSQVSRLHARIIFDARDDEYFLEDVDSRNGTFIGQSRVRGRVALEPGTLFRIGRTWLRIDRPPLTGIFIEIER